MDALRKSVGGAAPRPTLPKKCQETAKGFGGTERDVDADRRQETPKATAAKKSPAKAQRKSA